MFETHVSSVSFVFKRMLQMFFLDISKVDRMLLLGLACCDITARAQTSGHRKRMGRKQSLQEVKRRGQRRPCIGMRNRVRHGHPGTSPADNLTSEGQRLYSAL
jgi:hypothetical protein